LRESSNAAPTVCRSVFLRSDGCLLADDGSPSLEVSVAPGSSYYMAIKHRNHLAVMSAQPVAFTNQTISHDFTAAADRYFGGSAGAIEVEPGVWAMAMGDADCDGEVLSVDQQISLSHQGRAGYRRGDFNLNGAISSADIGVAWTANVGRVTCVPDGAYSIVSELRIDPGKRTVVSGATNEFCAVGATGTVQWAMARSPSGAQLTPKNATSVVYRAGSRRRAWT